MSKNFVQNAALRSTLVAGYRLYARMQFWRTGPRIFINSIPKAGTHLLTAELQRFETVSNSMLHFKASDLIIGEKRADELPKLDIGRIRSAVGTIREGQYFSGHLYWDPAIQELMDEQVVSTIFVVRDPRDILMSLLHYAKGLKRHWLHEFLTNNFDNDVDRLRALIHGKATDPVLRSQRDTLEGYTGWAQCPNVLTIRFEDLVGERGGGTAEAKLTALTRIAEHVGLPLERIEALSKSATGPTPTLRKGKIGGWRSEMPPEIIAEYARTCGDIIASFGYDPE